MRNRNMEKAFDRLVTIIVPVFNVEKYIGDCVNSITNQTYKNLEIILVDDGSNDRSAFLIDQFARADSRINVLHKQNGGVSSARNAGLSVAHGDYVCFVDADDRIAPEFVEYFMSVAVLHNADLVMSTQTIEGSLEEESINHKFEVWTSEKSTSEILYAKFPIGCWNKIFKRSVIVENNMSFPVGFFMGEGLNFITNFAQIAKKIVATNRALYFYRRDNLDSATTAISVNKMENALNAIKYIRENLTIKSRKIKTALDFHEWLTAFFSVVGIIKLDAIGQNELFYRSCWIILRKNSLPLFFCARVSSRRRFLLLAVFLLPTFFVEKIIKRVQQ